MNRKPLRGCVVPRPNRNGVTVYWNKLDCPCRDLQEHVDLKFWSIVDNNEWEWTYINTIISMEAKRDE